MEREVIWGKKVNNNFTVTDQPENKIIETLDEVREALHYDAEFSKFDTELYPHTLPDNLPYAYEDGQKTSVWEDGFITTSCILADKSNPDSFTLPETIKVKAENDDIWIGLKNVKMDPGANGSNCRGIVCYPGGGIVKFMFDGDNNYMNECSIASSLFYDEANNKFNKDGNAVTVRYDDTWGIEFYGTEDSALSCINPCSFTGTFKAPTLTLGTKKSGGIKVNYVDEYGETHPNEFPVVLGSALVEKLTEAQNEFNVLNSGGGGNQGSGGLLRGQRNWYQLTYYMGV